MTLPASCRGQRNGLATRAVIHLAPARVGRLDFASAEITGLAGTGIGVEAILFTPGQALLFQRGDEPGWIDDTAGAVGTPGQGEDLAGQFSARR
jgi:hypothetical protein